VGSRAAAITIGAIAAGALVVGGIWALSNDGTTEPTVLGVQITSPTAPTGTSGDAPVAAATTTTSPPTTSSSTTSSTSTTVPPSTTSSSTTTTSTTVAGGGGGGSSGTTTTTTATTTTPPTTSTTTTTVPPTTTSTTTTSTTTTTTSTTTTTTTTLPAATNPDELSSPTHEIGESGATTDNRITVTWTPPAGAVAYSILWSPQAVANPDEVAELPGAAAQTVSPALAPGRWFFNLRTQGPGGNWANRISLGPFFIEPESSPPHFSSMSIDPPAIYETDSDGSACALGPSEATVTASLTDPDDDVDSVTLRWTTIDTTRSGTQPVDFDPVSMLATTTLSFPAGTVRATEANVVVGVRLVAEDSTGLVGDSSADVGIFLITLRPCR
jgi:hypothetical protein